MYSYSESSGNIERVNIGSRGIQGNIDPVYDKLGTRNGKDRKLQHGQHGAVWSRHTYDYKSAGGNESVLVFERYERDKAQQRHECGEREDVELHVRRQREHHDDNRRERHRAEQVLL